MILKIRKSNALHSYLHKRPINEVDHGDLWQADREAYWMQGAEEVKVRMNCG